MSMYVTVCVCVYEHMHVVASEARRKHQLLSYIWVAMTHVCAEI